jgi:hypothetical protein
MESWKKKSGAVIASLVLFEKCIAPLGANNTFS